jgi:tetratricopeptide (TPR) repeat protein
MPISSGSVNLERIHRCEGALGIGTQSVSDAGQIGYLARDPAVARTYRLATLLPSKPNEPDRLIQHDGFGLESVHRCSCSPDGAWAYLLTDHDVYFIMQNGAAVQRSSLQVRHGDTFVDLRVAASDQRRTALVLTQDRGSTSFTITLLESHDTPGVLSVVWSKTWSEPVLAVALSSGGEFVSVALQSGTILLLDRQRQIVWTHAGEETSPIIALAVDSTGSVAALASSGEIKRLDSGEGNVVWRVLVPVKHPDIRGNIPATLLTVDSRMRTVLCAVNQSEHLDDLHGTYLLLNGRNGDVLWDDQVDSAVIGIAISPAGHFCTLSVAEGDVMLLSISGRRQHLVGADAEMAAQLLGRAQRAFNNYNFAKAVHALQEAFEIDPSLAGAGQLYDEACWHYRESVLKKTRSISAQSLAQVEDALTLMRHDERLTIRRNALARLVAEALGREATECANEGEFEESITKYREALSIDRNQTELRNALRIVCDQLALALIKEADNAFHEERFEEAIEMLERVQELRPGESAISQRLEHAKGLHAYAIGMSHYISKRYQEAAFWFRKTLTLLPEHAEAARYLGFAGKFGRNQSVESTTNVPSEVTVVSQRFGMLE